MAWLGKAGHGKAWTVWQVQYKNLSPIPKGINMARLGKAWAA
jgi:hypothetical protein